MQPRRSCCCRCCRCCTGAGGCCGAATWQLQARGRGEAGRAAQLTTPPQSFPAWGQPTCRVLPAHMPPLQTHASGRSEAPAGPPTCEGPPGPTALVPGSASTKAWAVSPSASVCSDAAYHDSPCERHGQAHASTRSRVRRRMRCRVCGWLQEAGGGGEWKGFARPTPPHPSSPHGCPHAPGCHHLARSLLAAGPAHCVGSRICGAAWHRPGRWCPRRTSGLACRPPRPRPADRGPCRRGMRRACVARPGMHPHSHNARSHLAPQPALDGAEHRVMVAGGPPDPVFCTKKSRGPGATVLSSF